MLVKSKGNFGEEKYVIIMYIWILSFKWFICNKRLIYDDLRGLKKKNLIKNYWLNYIILNLMIVNRKIICYYELEKI